MKAFIFRITQFCDKKCPTCCCGSREDILDPDRYKKKLLDIREYCTQEHDEPVVIFTGGEAFFYRSRGKTGKRYNIADLVDLTARILPNAKIVVKTAGWTPHRVLDGLLHRIETSSMGRAVDVRFGFSLYQKNGLDADERLHHMINSILGYQDIIRIEIIYDKENLPKTLDTLVDGFATFGFASGDQLKASMNRPESYYRFKIPVRYTDSTKTSASIADKMIYLSTMPAHEGLDSTNVDRFYKANWEDLCPIIEFGPDHILYNPDLSFYQCNDSFADYSKAAFNTHRFESVREEFAFLEEKFSRLKSCVEGKQLSFKTKREQCLFCSGFVHSVFPDQMLLKSDSAG